MKLRSVQLEGKVRNVMCVCVCVLSESCYIHNAGIMIGPGVEERQKRSVEREARRRRRREKRQKDGVTNHEEGVSSDDELLETNRLKFLSDKGE